MHEIVGDRAVLGPRHQQPGAHEVVEAAFVIGVVQQRRGRLERERVAERGRELEHGPVLRAERSGETPSPLLHADRHLACAGVFAHLFDERNRQERVAARAFPDPVGEPELCRLGRRPVDQLADLIARQWLDDERTSQVVLAEVVEQRRQGRIGRERLAPCHRDHERARLWRVPGQVVERFEGRRVRLMDVVERHDQRSGRREGLDRGGDGVQDGQPGRRFGLRSERQRRRDAGE